MNSSDRNFSRRDVLLLLLLAGLIGLFFWRILTPNPADRAQFPAGDFTDQFYAFRLYEARAFASGRLPLWSENFNSGHPFLADVQAAVFYPLGLANTLINVTLFGPNFPFFALELEAILHFVLAGGFTFLFARRVIGSRAGAFAAALIFTFGGYLTSYPSLQLAILETATWLPLALYFLHSATPPPSPLGKSQILEAKARGGGYRGVDPANFVYAGIVLGIAALAGHSQTFLFVLATSIIYFAFRVWAAAKVSPVNRRGTILFFLVCLPIAFGIAAAQWIPAFEYQQLSTREALSFSQAAAGFPTLDLLQFILPGFTSAFASPLYAGILPLWLACFALARRSRERVFWGLLALGALVLSFGFYVFGYALLYLLPGGGLFRQQERLAFVVSFCVAMLAGYGLSNLLAFDPGERKLARKLFLLLPAGVTVSFVLLITFFVAGTQQSTGRLAFLGDRAGLMLFLFALTCVLVGAYLQGWISPRALAPLACALILLDLFSVNEPANKGAAAERYPANPLIQAVQEDSTVFRVADEAQLPGHFGIAYQLEAIGGISPLRLAHYDKLLGLAPEKLLPLLNVKYLFTRRTGFASAETVAKDGETLLLRLNNMVPRAWLVGAAQVFPNDDLALERMQASDFDPRHTALLAWGAPFDLDPRAQAGSVTFQVREPERLTLAVNAPADGVLLVSENYYPGWVARVDNAEVEILRADVSLRAVPLRAGTHRVEFIYDPPSVKIGISVSTLTLLLCIVSLFSIRVGSFRRERLEVEPRDAATLPGQSPNQSWQWCESRVPDRRGQSAHR
jgi:hypothetical protein